jgi:histidinol-phosphate aminotransferase
MMVGHFTSRENHMKTMLDERQKSDFLERGFSRRDFGRIAALIAGAAVLPASYEAAYSQIAVTPGLPPGAVKIDSNENPAGPCKEALDALTEAGKNGGRYMMDMTDTFCQVLADQEGVKKEYVKAYAGSSPALHLTVLAFCGPDKPLVMADPGYEAGTMAAGFIGAKTVKVPLTKSYAHDVKGMAAVKNAGVIYLVNPNNPTGTLTPREDIEWVLANKPAGSILLLDEAYIHIAGAPMCTDLVRQDKDIMVLRTFSKIYGMAGLRAGAAIARPDLLQKIAQYMYAPQATTAMAAAIASLNNKSLVSERRKVIGDIREENVAYLKGKGYAVVPSVSNKFMVDVRKPATEVVQALRKEKVWVGRVWPSWPTHIRVSVGLAEEMKVFREAFMKVMA